MHIKFTRISGNSKTGPIPTTISQQSTCPDACPLKSAGCYALYGTTGLHWRKTNNGESVTDWAGLCDNIKSLPKGQLWRHNVAGDLPHNLQFIDSFLMNDLVKANKGRNGFTYTHHDISATKAGRHNRKQIKQANEQGFTINLSANNPEHADQLKALNIAPVVCIVAEDAAKVTHTPKGNTIVICPATYRDDVQCANCGVCAVATRNVIIGFPVHGSGRKKALKNASEFKGIPVTTTKG